MADKEERILIARSTDYTLTDTDKGELFEGKIAPHCANVMTRAEAIERIATGYCGGICEKCTDGPKGSEHCIKWIEFRGTMKKAEAALNALLE